MEIKKRSGDIAKFDVGKIGAAMRKAFAATGIAIAEQQEGKLVVAKINADEEPELLRQNNIERPPTLKLFYNGESKGQIVAPGTKSAIDAFVQSALEEQA